MKTLTHKTYIAWLCYVTFLVLSFAQYSHAHPMKTSQVEARYNSDHWMLTLKLPHDRLVIAMNNKVTEAELKTYVYEHITASSSVANNQQWNEEIVQVSVPDDHAYWKVTLKLTPPIAALLDSFEINYQVITEKIITHKVHFWLMPEKDNEKSPKHLKTLRGRNTVITIKR